MIKMIDLFLALAHDHVDNYVIPGLRSSMIKDLGSRGKVRLFQMQRTQVMDITPHSHRYDLSCFVLRGSVENTVWEQANCTQTDMSDLDYFLLSEQSYADGDSFGSYVTTRKMEDYFEPTTTTHNAGDEYFLHHEDIHHIRFSRDAVVLVFESQRRSKVSKFIEPALLNDEFVHTFKVEPWMFKKSAV